MDVNLRDRIWPEYTSNWFMPTADASVPHNYSADNAKANNSIKRYLSENGLNISQNWLPDEIFHENIKRWIGYCSVPYHTLIGNTPTQPLYMSFFPFIFEVVSAAFLNKFDSYITQPNFLEFGNSIVIRQEQPDVVQRCMNGILASLINFENPKYGFIHRVLINDDVESNISDMGFECNGNFWLRLNVGLKDQVINDINNPHARITSDRSIRIREMKTHLASADSYFKLDVENENGYTRLLFKQKTDEEIDLQEAAGLSSGIEKEDVLMNSKESQQRANNAKQNKSQKLDRKQTRTKQNIVFNNSSLTNVMMGDNSTQNNYVGEKKK